VKLRKVIQRQLRHNKDGVSVAADINAVVSATVNEPGVTKTTVSSKSRIVQRGGKTERFESQANQEDEK
jgi:hypothetical protein